MSWNRREWTHGRDTWRPRPHTLQGLCLSQATQGLPCVSKVALWIVGRAARAVRHLNLSIPKGSLKHRLLASPPWVCSKGPRIGISEPPCDPGQAWGSEDLQAQEQRERLHHGVFWISSCVTRLLNQTCKSDAGFRKNVWHDGCVHPLWSPLLTPRDPACTQGYTPGSLMSHCGHVAGVGPLM